MARRGASIEDMYFLTCSTVSVLLRALRLKFDKCRQELIRHSSRMHAKRDVTNTTMPLLFGKPCEQYSQISALLWSARTIAARSRSPLCRRCGCRNKADEALTPFERLPNWNPEIAAFRLKWNRNFKWLGRSSSEICRSYPECRVDKAAAGR
jgi:hypothetical protein